MSICNLKKGKIPALTLDSPFLSVTKTEDELSCVCAEGYEPKGAICERGFVAMKICGILSFSLVGVLESLLAPLKEANISVFVVSTYKTDYILIKERDVLKAVKALSSICLIEK